MARVRLFIFSSRYMYNSIVGSIFLMDVMVMELIWAVSRMVFLLAILLFMRTVAS